MVSAGEAGELALEAVLKAGRDRLAKEDKTRERLRNGELGLDFYGLREKLIQMGVEFVDHNQDAKKGN